MDTHRILTIFNLKNMNMNIDMVDVVSSSCSSNTPQHIQICKVHSHYADYVKYGKYIPITAHVKYAKHAAMLTTHNHNPKFRVQPAAGGFSFFSFSFLLFVIVIDSCGCGFLLPLIFPVGVSRSLGE
jgi:hypothetical protein